MTNMNITLSDDGNEYEIARFFNARRVIISYQGTFVFADLVDVPASDGMPAKSVWSLSGDPPRTAEEKLALDKLIAPTLDKTVVTVTKDEP